MSNPWYTRVFNALPGQKVRSQALKSELDLIQAAFDALTTSFEDGDAVVSGDLTLDGDLIFHDAAGDFAAQTFVNTDQLILGGATYLTLLTFDAAGALELGTNSTVRWQVGGTGHMAPKLDNTYNIGNGSFRVKELFAATGTINTSDAREKTAVSSLSPSELAAAIDLGKEVGHYRWLAAVALKGDGARRHIGMTVQRAIEIMQGHGLDPFAFGFICYDQWEREERLRPPMREGDEPVLEVTEAGDRYSFRMDELMLFIAAGFNARLAALEA